MPDLPRDWDALGARLDSWTPPQGAFDPAAAWTLRYARHSLVPEINGGPGGGPAGLLAIEQKPEPDALTLLAAESVAAGFSSPTTTAEIACARDALLTPRRWTLSVRWHSGPLADLRPGEIDQARSGRADGQDLVFLANQERRRPAPARWTGFWNLFAAVPRLPFDAGSVLSFDLFEELELHKPGQRLAYAGPQAVELRGQTLALHVFEQTGRGVLPWRWWLDGQHRVLLAAGGRRAYLLDATKKGGAA
jgi:hypothetical protein